MFNVCCLLMPWTITDKTVNCQKDFERQVFHMYLWMNWQKSKLKQIEVMNYQTKWIVETGNGFIDKWWNRGLKSWFEWRHLGGSIKNSYFKDHVKRIKLLTTTNWLDYLLYRRTKNGFHNFCCYVFIIKAVKISLIFTDSRSNNSIYVQLLLILQYAFIC